jgi:2'-hydroxyisoflavone reductase
MMTDRPYCVQQPDITSPEEHMGTTRRDFLQLTATAAGAAALGGAVPHPLAAAMRRAAGPVERANSPLRILILGGTGFTGPHQIQYALARGHHITVFNRGRRQAGLPAGVEHLQGDRNDREAGVNALKEAVARGTKWDVVIDNPTTLPFWVRDAASVLAPAAQQYIFISTISVYGDTSKRGMDEDTVLAEYQGADVMAETMQTFQASGGQLYAPLKVASEREAEKHFPGRTTVIRPGLIVGPGDMTGRFTYWPLRIAKGGEVLAPGTGHDAVQIIDARDLAEWTIRVAEQRTIGTFNATGPAGEMSIAEMLGGIRAAFDGTKPVKLTWVPGDFLEQQQIRGWSDMPVWVPPTPEMDGFSRVSIARALAQGLTFRPLAVTAADTVTWYESLPQQAWFQELNDQQKARVAGVMTEEREKAALAAWHARATASS